MGVYIKSMEMPEHCGYCRFRYDGICHALQKTQYKQDECPLVEVPKHGRLIDSDVLKDCYERIGKDRWNQSIGAAKYFDEAIDLLDYTPTVIEADSPDEVTDVGCKVCNTNCNEAGTDGEMCSAWTKKPTAEAEEDE